MPFKTILVHLADDKGHTARLRLGIDLASRFEAHLVALYIATPVSMPAAITGRGASFAYIAEATTVAHEKAATIEAEIRSTCERERLSWEWRVEEGDHLDIMAQYAHYADLAIVSHSRAELIEDRVMFHVPEDLPLTVACPVIILPERQDFRPPGKNVLVAWKATREALHTVRAALPILESAETVTVLSVSPPEADPRPDEMAAAFLARHGVKAQAYADIDGNGHVGEVILAHARDMDVDLIVMGGYGHSRLREMVVGGVTRHVLDHMQVPVLMGH
ncbi:MAG: universal stress protein [Alphaproteobacteria bacterium]